MANATSIYFNGRFTQVPGSYSEVDASGLAGVNLAATGIVACLGTAIGGKPYSAVDLENPSTTLQKSTRPGKAKTYFESGSPLLNAEDILFSPSSDPDIAGGAQEVFWLKVNASAPSTLMLQRAGVDTILLTSEAYGYKTTRISWEQGAGTNKGLMLSLTLDDLAEVLDDVGGDVIFTIQFTATTPALGYTTMAATAGASALSFAFTKTGVAGLDTDITNPVTVLGYNDSAKVEMISDSAADTMVVTLYGTDDTGAAQQENLTLTGTTVVQSVLAYNKLMGARIASAPAGNITIRNLTGGSTVITLTPLILTKGLYLPSELWATSFSVAADAPNARQVAFFGVTSAGAAVGEAFTLTGITPIASSASFKRIDYIALGDFHTTRSISMTAGVALSASYALDDTLQKLADRVNSYTGMVFTLLTGDTAMDPGNMDQQAAVNVLASATGSWYANLQAMLDAINDGSSLATAAKQATATGTPDNTVSAVYFAGGNEGSSTPGQEGTPTASFSDWQAALDLLKGVFVNSIVVLTSSPAVHAALKSHISYMCGAGRMERDGFVGLENAAQTALPTKTEIKSQIVALGSRHLRACAQTIDRYDPDGTLTTFEPFYQACLACGMQAGSPVGTALTNKLGDALAIGQDASWSSRDDQNEMISLGLLFMEVVDGTGRRFVRNITTYLKDSNLAYREGSVNEASNYFAYNFRVQMEAMVGRTGFTGTEEAAEGLAREILTELIDVAITSWKSLAIDLTLDVLEVSVEGAPVIPINFVKNTIHLVAIPQSNAAA